MEALAPYLEGFRTLPPAKRWLQSFKQEALDRASGRGFPAARDEAWKYTSVAALEKRGFRPSSSETRLGAATLAKLTIAGLDVPRAVFVNGHYDAGLSNLPAGARVIEVGTADESLHPLLAVSPEWRDDTFVNLNTAFFQAALVLELAANTALEVPLELLHVSLPEADPASHHLRCVVKLGAHGQAALIERYLGRDGAKHLTNAVTQVTLEPGSRLTHIRLQEESPQGFHVGRMLVRQGKDSSYVSHNIQIGSSWSRLDLATDLEAPGARAVLNGLYAVNGRMHIDNHTHINHLAPHTASTELYRGVLDGHGRAVFNGRVRVAKHAVKADSAQANHNLLLSRGAEIDTKPELEIYADDVKCSHGATIGQLDEEQLFYLRSRGIDAESARALLIGAFTEQLLAELPEPALAEHARRALRGAIRALSMPEQP
ncbi:MAG TPA: Fe-S cluster assembly protein SufD [Gammaproteobacteria bacterium]|jgi:Fe-S cluster assembly protein SufD